MSFFFSSVLAAQGSEAVYQIPDDVRGALEVIFMRVGVRRMRLVILMTLMVAIGCSPSPSGEAQPESTEGAEFAEEFGSADEQRMHAFERELSEAGIPFQHFRPEGITVISWRPIDDRRVRSILCAIFPLPPPNDRSVAMSSPELMAELKRALRAKNVRFGSESFAGIEFLIFDPDAINEVRSVFFNTFGYELKQGPSLDEVAELMECDGSNAGSDRPR